MARGYGQQGNYGDDQDFDDQSYQQNYPQKNRQRNYN